MATSASERRRRRGNSMSKALEPMPGISTKGDGFSRWRLCCNRQHHDGAGVYGKITGTANSGYAGYFANTATSGTNYAIYASNASANGYGINASNTNSVGVALFCSSTYSNGCGGNEGWYNTSDGRLKAGVTTLPPSRGVAAVMKLRP